MLNDGIVGSSENFEKIQHKRRRRGMESVNNLGKRNETPESCLYVLLGKIPVFRLWRISFCSSVEMRSEMMLFGNIPGLY